MSTITVRDLSPETRRALEARAAQHGRSTEAEIRDILDRAARAEDRVKLGSLLAAAGREARLTEDEWARFHEALEREDAPAEPPRLDG